MTAMPQMVAPFNGKGGATAALVSVAAIALLSQVGCMSMPASAHSAPAVKRGVARAPFGAIADGRLAELFTLTNPHGIEGG